MTYEQPDLLARVRSLKTGQSWPAGLERYDTYRGWQPVLIEAYRTKRMHMPVTAFRVITFDRLWQAYPRFTSAEHALAWCRYRPYRARGWRFTDVTQDPRRGATA